MESRVPSLMEILREVPEPRQCKGLRHPVHAILGLVCVGILCGCRSIEAISDWGRNYDERFRRALGFGHRPPCGNTIRNLLSRLDIVEVENRLSSWARRVLALIPLPEGEKEAIAIDGKTLRGSKKQGAPAAHLLSALGVRLGLTLGQEAVAEKTNEIPVMEKVLAGLVLQGSVITVDALLTQREIAKTIVANGGDYVMMVKENQPTLEADIRLVLENPRCVAETMKVAETVDSGHGRIEERRLTTTTALKGYLDWPGAEQVFPVERTTLFKKQRTTRQDVVYGITSLSREEAGAAALLEYVRRHWYIENRSHWIRDVDFGEDHSQVRRGSLPQAMAAFRNTAIGLLRLANVKNIAAACRRFAARPEEALQLIGVPLKC